MDQSDAILALRDEMKAGFNQVVGRLDQTNARLDQTVERLVETNVELRQFRSEVSEKLDGIGAYLRTSDRHLDIHDERILKLERRVDDIDRRLGA